jgi:hypothetical protein
MATIGRAKAVARIWRIEFSGLVAWLLWSLVHIQFLIGFRNKLVVMVQWMWAYVSSYRAARLITNRSISMAPFDSMMHPDQPLIEPDSPPPGEIKLKSTESAICYGADCHEYTNEEGSRVN